MSSSSNSVVAKRMIGMTSLGGHDEAVTHALPNLGDMRTSGNHAIEYSASEMRKMLQALFPHRRLVLSQFTFFNQIGIARPTGATFRRGRRCYRLLDMLPIACILALKEEGIPFKNIEALPKLVHQHAEAIFAHGEGCRLSGYGEAISLTIPGLIADSDALDAFLGDHEQRLLFWGFDVGLLADQLATISSSMTLVRVANAA